MNLRQNWKSSYEASLQARKSAVWSVDKLLALLFMVSLISPFLRQLGHGFILSWGAYIFWFFTTLMQRKMRLQRVYSEIFNRRFELIMLFCWTMVIFLNFLGERGYTGRVYSLYVMNFCMLVFMEIYYSSSGDDTFNKLLAAFIVLICIECFLSLPTLFRHYSLPRMIMDVSVASQLDLYKSAALSGVGECSYYTGLAIISPVIFVQMFRLYGIQKFLVLVAFVIIAMAISLSTFLSANLLLVTGLCLIGLYKVGLKRNKSTIWFIFLSLIFVVLWNITLVYLPQIQFLFYKVSNMRDSILLKGLLLGDKTQRVQWAMLSLDTFLNHPFFGVGPSTGQNNPYLYTLVGGHAGWIDNLAEYGLIGFGFHIAYLLALVRRVIVSFKKNGDPNLLLGRMIACFLFFLCGIYNPIVMDPLSFSMLYIIALGGTYRNQVVLSPGSRKILKHRVLQTPKTAYRKT